MPLNAPVITGTGIICAAGCDTAAVWDSIRQGKTGLGPLTLFPSPRYEKHPVGQVRQDVDSLAGAVRGSRSDKLAWIAAQQALAEAGLTGLKTVQLGRTGLVIGTTVGGMLGSERALERLLRWQQHRFGPFRFHECASSTGLCGRMLGVTGPCATVSTACSAGAMALLIAAQMLTSGEADVVIAGGADSLCRLTLNGFGSLLLLDPAGCRPFDARRAGISLGEGAAMLVLETEEHALARRAPVLARLTGWGASCDAWHATAPEPEGRGALAAMQRAVRCAGLQARDIAFVSAHGTGTPDNDAMEAKAIRQLFGDRPPAVASVKRFFGHTLAASGAIKAVLAVQTLREQSLPPSLGLTEPDSALGLELVREFRAAEVSHLLSNSFGFGGNNVALVFSRAELGAPARLPGSSLKTHTPEVICGPASTNRARLAVVGRGFMCAAGTSMGELSAGLRAGGVALSSRPTAGPGEVRNLPVYACGSFGAEQAIDPARLRRLSRFQRMALVAARTSLPAEGFGNLDRVCVGFGTGLGSLNDTAAFLENMILKDERAPRPLFFTNSVHNTLASQVAIEFGLRGANFTSVQREISFETALWQMGRELAQGDADFALVGAADELNSYHLAAGLRWGWWSETSKPFLPFGGQLTAAQQPLPGEGCAVLTLARPDAAPSRLAEVSSVHIGRAATKGQGVDATAEAEWIHRALESDGVGDEEGEMLLTGANGLTRLDRTYREVAEELSKIARKPILCGAYKQACGEFASASALGFMVAVGLVRGEIAPETCLPAGEKFQADRCRHVVLYTLARDGMRSVCRISA